MRSFRLTTALAAAATLLALAPATALAFHKPVHKQRHAAAPAGPCKVRLNVAPRLIYTGSRRSPGGERPAPGTKTRTSR